MKINLIAIGKTDEAYVEDGCQIYEKRIMHYLPYARYEIPSTKINYKYDKNRQLEAEASLLEKNLEPEAFVVLLLSLIHISEPTRLLSTSYAVFCLKKKKQT